MDDKEQKMRRFIERTDWKGLAEAWQKEDIKWHAEEWKKFIGGIRSEAFAAGEKSGARKEREENISVIEECCPSYESPLGKVYRVGEWVLTGFRAARSISGEEK